VAAGRAHTAESLLSGVNNVHSDGAARAEAALFFAYPGFSTRFSEGTHPAALQKKGTLGGVAASAAGMVFILFSIFLLFLLSTL
jgi:hypothetical protein